MSRPVSLYMFLCVCVCICVCVFCICMCVCNSYKTNESLLSDIHLQMINILFSYPFLPILPIPVCVFVYVCIPVQSLFLDMMKLEKCCKRGCVSQKADQKPKVFKKLCSCVKNKNWYKQCY